MAAGAPPAAARWRPTSILVVTDDRALRCAIQQARRPDGGRAWLDRPAGAARARRRRRSATRRPPAAAAASTSRAGRDGRAPLDAGPRRDDEARQPAAAQPRETGDAEPRAARPAARMRAVTILDQISQAVVATSSASSRSSSSPTGPALIALLPFFVLIGVVGPLLTLAVLAWLGYGVTKPRTKVRYDEGTRVAPRDHLGEPIVPAGEPYCPRDGLIYPSGRRAATATRRCSWSAARSARSSATRTSRPAATAASSCKIEPRALIVATDGPPPGGAAVA